MKILCISDTHNRHEDIIIPETDMIIHAGDLSSLGKKNEIELFLKWFSELPHKHKILIAGNHDFGFETHAQWCKEIMPDNINYLNDCGVTIEGLNIWGSPITPYFHNWAFNRYRGLNIQPHWDLIPEGTDIIVTHGPAYGFVDELDPHFVRFGEDRNIGCEDLLYRIEQVKPKLHVCGHIHSNGGIMESNGETLFVNASVLNESYIPLRTDPVVIDWVNINVLIVEN